MLWSWAKSTLLYAAIIFASLVACVVIFKLIKGDTFAPSKPKFHRVEVGGVHMVIPSEFVYFPGGNPDSWRIRNSWRQGKKSLVGLHAGLPNFESGRRDVRIILRGLTPNRHGSTQQHIEEIFFKDLETRRGQPGPSGLRIHRHRNPYPEVSDKHIVEDIRERTKFYSYQYDDDRLLMIKCDISRCSVHWRGIEWLEIKYEFKPNFLSSWRDIDGNVMAMVRWFMEDAQHKK